MDLPFAFVLSGSNPALHDLLTGGLSSGTAQALGFTHYSRGVPVHPHHVRALHMSRMGTLRNFLWMLKYSTFPTPAPKHLNEVLRCFCEDRGWQQLPFPPCELRQADEKALIEKRFRIGHDSVEHTLADLFLSTWGTPRAVAQLVAPDDESQSSASARSAGRAPNSVALGDVGVRSTQDGTFSDDRRHNGAPDWNLLLAMASLLLRDAPTAPALLSKNPFDVSVQHSPFSIEEVNNKFALMRESGIPGVGPGVEEQTLYSMAEAG